MNLTAISAKLGIPEATALFKPHWGDSIVSCPEPGAVHFLQDEELAFCARYGCFPEKHLTDVQALAAEIRANPGWRLWVWHLYRLLFVERDYPASMIAQWPYPVKGFGERAFLIYMLPFLGCVRLIRERHREMGIDEAITRDTCPNSHLHDHLATFARLRGGKPGIFTNALYWFRHHVKGEMFRLGRLEYKRHAFPSTVLVFREKRTGRILALLNDDFEVNDEGLMDATEAKRPERRYRVSRLTRTDERVVGLPVHPAGRVCARSVVLSATEWEPALLPGDPVLDVHIPPGDGLTVPDLRASFKQALEFFPRVFPGFALKGFSSISWMFNPELEAMLPAESRLVQFLRQGYLYPRPAKGTEGLRFIFGEDEIDLATVPRDTSLRKIFAEKMEAGGGSRNGGFFLLHEHVGQFGRDPYRSDWSRDFRRDVL